MIRKRVFSITKKALSRVLMSQKVKTENLMIIPEEELIMLSVTKFLLTAIFSLVLVMGSEESAANAERERLINRELGEGWGISHNICSMWESVMRGQTLPFRRQGIPVSTAEDTYNSEDDVGTRLFLKQFVRTLYGDPALGQQALDDGRFFILCVKEHRGY